MKRLFDRWDLLAYLAGILVMIGVNYAQLQQLPALQQKLDATGAKLNDHDRAIALIIQASETQARTVATLEGIVRADHDATIGMGAKLDRVANWVDRQDASASGRGH